MSDDEKAVCMRRGEGFVDDEGAHVKDHLFFAIAKALLVEPAA